MAQTQVSLSTLQGFVFQSNWIEGYTPYNYGENSALFREHLATAQYVARTQTWDPLDLHTRLFGGTGLGMLEPQYVGIYRNSQVYIGDFYPPSPGAHLLRHIQRWQDMVAAGPGDMDPERWCWQVHDEYECIHPFVDGNGRTGRLILNAMRLRVGLPWLTVHQGDEQQAYYANIRAYQRDGRWQCSQWKPEDGHEALLSREDRIILRIAQELERERKAATERPRSGE